MGARAILSAFNGPSTIIGVMAGRFRGGERVGRGEEGFGGVALQFAQRQRKWGSGDYGALLFRLGRRRRREVGEGVGVGLGWRGCWAVFAGL